METWEINGYTLEYDDETHTYIVDGVIVPSVTQLLNVKFGNKYDHVNRDTLKRAAEHGTAIHKAIEEYCLHGDYADVKEVRNFHFLMKYHSLYVLGNEKPIILFKDDKPIAAGRFDLLLSYLSGHALADIKTTATLDKEYLAFQLNLYRIGYMQSYKDIISALYGVHLKDDKRKLVSIPINEAIAWEIINEYLERGKE